MRRRLTFFLGCCLLAAALAPLPAGATPIVDWTGPGYYIKNAYYDKDKGTYFALAAGPFSSKADCQSWLTSHFDELEQMGASCEYFASTPYPPK
ncbi:MAG: hypothetical protein KGJ78_17670 [Alphaproteobacteria bacterium]|nr:hypothetical protein [Alphaproteobacteria bacterium]